jgi:hypothetical protein
MSAVCPVEKVVITAQSVQIELQNANHSRTPSEDKIQGCSREPCAICGFSVAEWDVVPSTQTLHSAYYELLRFDRERCDQRFSGRRTQLRKPTGERKFTCRNVIMARKVLRK